MDGLRPGFPRLDGWMNEWRGLLGSWRGPHHRLDPLEPNVSPSPRLFALGVNRLGPTHQFRLSRVIPVARHDEWSTHYGEVPGTKSRDEMSPFACERPIRVFNVEGGGGDVTRYEWDG